MSETSRKYVEKSGIPQIEEELLNKFGLTSDDIDFVVGILRDFKNVNPSDFEEKIESRLPKYNQKSQIINNFINLFDELSLNDSLHPFRFWISQNFQYFWKEVLVKIISKVENETISLEADNVVNETKNGITEVLEARKIISKDGFEVTETGPENSDTVLISFGTFFSKSPTGLRDGYNLNGQTLGSTTYGGGRSSYTKAIEHSINPNSQTPNKIWYVDYPESGDFNTSIAIDSLVNKLREDGITNINIHGASMGGKLAMELALKLARSGIKVNKIFINGGAILPEHIKFLGVQGEIGFFPESTEIGRIRTALSFIEGFVFKNIGWLGKRWTLFNMDSIPVESNSHDIIEGENINSGRGVSFGQIMERMNYLKRYIDFAEESQILREYVGEVIAINSIPKPQAKTDGMVSTDYPIYLREVFGRNKVREIKVDGLPHYHLGFPGTYAREIRKNTP